MKKLLTIFLLAATTSISLAQVPGTISYQGLLTDSNGLPIEGTVSVTFKFYKGDTEVLDATLNRTLSVTTYKGLFTVILGSGVPAENTALPTALGDQPCSIGITYLGTELTPRAKLTTVPYAFRAQVASTLDATATINGSQVTAGIDATRITTGTLPAARIGSGSVNNAMLAADINAAKITTGTLPASVLPATEKIPPGTVIAFAGTMIPTGWLLCDGTAVSRTTTYNLLFAAIGVSWGGGNGTTTFNLPDLRGQFLRGNDSRADASKVDADAPRVVGSSQSDEFKSHYHGVSASNAGSGGNTPVSLSAGASIGNVDTTPTGGDETRPKNVSVNFIIKY